MIPLDAQLLGYTQAQYLDWNRRSSTIGEDLASFCLSLYTEKPEYWNEHQDEFKLKTAFKLSELLDLNNITPEEIKAQYVSQQVTIIIEMMNQAAKENRKH